MSLVDPLKHAVEVAVADQVAAGIDIISDGQVRGDMIHAFTSHLPGIRGSAVVGKVQPARQPITVTDTKCALSRHPKVKGILTGPSTLARPETGDVVLPEQGRNDPRPRAGSAVEAGYLRTPAFVSSRSTSPSSPRGRQTSPSAARR